MAQPPKERPSIPEGVHSYLHMAGRKGVHSYLKWPARSRTRGAAAPSSWKVADLCAAYDWPTNAPGGATIAIIELGGGWVQSDINQFFTGAGLPAPTLMDISVDGTANSRCNPRNDADGEVALDIQVAAAAYAVATGQAANIRVYWSQDITRAIVAATSDGCDVCSISWGSDEANWGAAAGDALEQAAMAATASGMIVFAASGDNDSSDGGPTPANVDLPASAPHIIGCGGTRKPQKGEETVWNDNPGKTNGEGTGGGFSTMFSMPAWQANAPHGRGRMVPDVAANADPNTGYEIVLYGAATVVGGTSAVAPLFSGLFASFGTRLGFVTPELWTNQSCFTDITRGDNGAYRAGVGPDPCTGLGSPIGKRLESLFTHPAATPTRWLRAAKAENERLLARIETLTDTARTGGTCPNCAAAAQVQPRAASVALGCCTISGNGPDYNITGIAEADCYKRAQAVDASATWHPGSCFQQSG